MVDEERQLPLALRLPDNETLASFYPGANGTLLAWLQQRLEQHRFAALFLHGADGTGKSHLVHALTAAFAARDQSCFAVALAEPERPQPEVLEGLEHFALVALDDLEAIAGDGGWEQAIFDLYNRMHEQDRGLLVITASQPPRALGIELPDLASRLDWGMVVRLQPLDDDAKLQALQLRAQLRGLTIGDEVGRYLLLHVERDMRSLCRVLERLDRASLAAQRRLTIPFVKQVLGL